MSWLLFAFLNPALHGLANILDNYISDKLFKQLRTLIFYSAVFDLIFLPILFLIDLPAWPTWQMIPFFILVGLTNIAYLFPYYKSLRLDDTSTVSSLFSLGKIFVPILAFLIVGEVVSPAQYLGFFIIVVASALLTVKNLRTLRFSKSFLYMLIASFLIALEIVIYKHILTNVSWITGLTWSSAVSFILVMLITISGKARADIRLQFPRFKQVSLLFGAEELLTFGGMATITYALTMAPVTLVEAIGSFQPFFVLLYAALFSKAFPSVFKEKLDRGNLARKSILFIIMILGTVLITKS